jgi:Na+-transporting NADH:ubiquinone oxidoreductase subunit C
MEKKESFSNKKTFFFVLILCTFAAAILSLVAEGLKSPQRDAKKLYKSKQLLLATQILSYEGTIDGVKATPEEILKVVEKRFLTRLTDDKGNLYTFDEVGIHQEEYLAGNAKLGFAHLPYKLIYVVKEKEVSKTPYGYVIPVNGYGLWDAIYGYLGLKANGDTILGMTWYDQKETPGLGGEIALPEWQEQFIGKVIFQKNSRGQTNIDQAELGIKVVKTTVKEIYGNRPIAASAVDGIPGASITVSGVNDAIRTSLTPYRPFLTRAYKGEIEIDE